MLLHQVMVQLNYNHEQLLTPYGKNIDPNNLLSDYPRPQLKRNSYLNLNGYWFYDITQGERPSTFNKTILVPFSPETYLSTVNKILMPSETLFYYREVFLPKDFKKDSLIIHFGAIDQTSEIYINDEYVYKHIGGYTPFSIDITKYISGNSFTILIKVTDLTDTSYHLVGKQRIKRGGIFYTPQSGIWQTVWLESVPKDYIKSLKMKTDINGYIDFFVDKTGSLDIDVKVYFNSMLVGNIITKNDNFTLNLSLVNLWSPENPNLYDIEISYGDDSITSYIGLRKVERKMLNDKMLFFLNNEPYFVNGLLDQAYYPDGLLTPPSYEIIRDDIIKMKSLGFNMLRMHIKISPYKFYEYCDKIGMLVFQDMINSNATNIKLHHGLNLIGIHLNDRNHRLFGRKNEIGRRLYEKDLKVMIDYLYNVTSLITWVPFNEGWGQFDSIRITELLKNLDDTRLIDHASGWADQKVGDYCSRHIYFKKINFSKKDSKKRILALTEFGGYSYPIENHRFNPNKIFGYKIFNTKDELQKAYKNLLINEVKPQIKKGLSVLIYTQVTDVEDEVNGLLTYDRKLLKMDEDFLTSINQELQTEFNTYLAKK